MFGTITNYSLLHHLTAGGELWNKYCHHVVMQSVDIKCTKEVTRRFHVGFGGVVAVMVFQRLIVSHSCGTRFCVMCFLTWKFRVKTLHQIENNTGTQIANGWTLNKGDKWMWQGISISWRFHKLGLRFVFVAVSQPYKGRNPATGSPLRSWWLNLASILMLDDALVLLYYFMALPLLKFSRTTFGIWSIWEVSWFGEGEVNAQLGLNSLHLKGKPYLYFLCAYLSIFFW